MFCHLLQNLVRYSRNIRACQSTLCHVHRMAYACCNDLCVNACNLEDLYDLTDQICSAYRDVIQNFNCF